MFVLMVSQRLLVVLALTWIRLTYPLCYYSYLLAAGNTVCTYCMHILYTHTVCTYCTHILYAHTVHTYCAHILCTHQFLRRARDAIIPLCGDNHGLSPGE
jgi:hypothetical protein